MDGGGQQSLYLRNKYTKNVQLQYIYIASNLVNSVKKTQHTNLLIHITSLPVRQK